MVCPVKGHEQAHAKPQQDKQRANTKLLIKPNPQIGTTSYTSTDIKTNTCNPQRRRPAIHVQPAVSITYAPSLFNHAITFII